MKGFRGISYDERINALKLQSLEKRSSKDNLVLTQDNIQMDLEEIQLLKFSRRPGLRRISLRLLHQTGRTRRRQSSFACRVVQHWNRLPLAVILVPDQRAVKNLLDFLFYFCPNIGWPVPFRSSLEKICSWDLTSEGSCVGSMPRNRLPMESCLSYMWLFWPIVSKFTIVHYHYDWSVLQASYILSVHYILTSRSSLFVPQRLRVQIYKQI